MITRKKKEPFDVITDPPEKPIELNIQGSIFTLPVVGTLDVDNNVFTPQGDALLDTAAAEPTINRYLDRSPKLNTQIDYEEMDRILKKKRAMFITAEQKRREPKVDSETPSESED